MSESSNAFETVDDDVPVRTGDPAVDAVLDQLADVEGTPVDEHVAVFERAHEQLRRALDAPSDTSS